MKVWDWVFVAAPPISALTFAAQGEWWTALWALFAFGWCVLYYAESGW